MTPPPPALLAVTSSPASLFCIRWPVHELVLEVTALLARPLDLAALKLCCAAHTFQVRLLFTEAMALSAPLTRVPER
jgi:hypothetical protein